MLFSPHFIGILVELLPELTALIFFLDLIFFGSTFQSPSLDFILLPAFFVVFLRIFLSYVHSFHTLSQTETAKASDGGVCEEQKFVECVKFEKTC